MKTHHILLICSGGLMLVSGLLNLLSAHGYRLLGVGRVIVGLLSVMCAIIMGTKNDN